MHDLRLIRQTLCLLLSAAICVIPTIGAAEELDGRIGTLDCVINPSVVADLGSSAPGILGRIHVDRSDFVEAGDVIAELDSGVEAASVDLARTRADSTAEVDLRRTNAAFGNRLRDRTKDLFKRKVVSNNDLDERETEARLAWIQLRQAQDNQSIAKLELVRAEEVLKRRTINSPITGVVMERFKVVGEYVEDQPVVRVAQLDPLHVEVIVPVDHLGKVTPGMTAEVWTDVVDGERWQAEVMRVDKVADVASGTYGVRLALPNPDYQIPAGLRCQMALADGPQRVAENDPAPEPRIEPVAKAARIKPDTTEAVQPPAARPEEPAPSELPMAQPAEPSPSEPPAMVEQVVTSENAVDVVATDTEIPEPTPEVLAAASAPVTGEAGAPGVQDPAAERGSEVEEAPVAIAVPPEEPSQIEPVALPPPESSVVERTEDSHVCRVAGPFRNEIDATRHVVKLRRAGLDVEMQAASKPTDVEYKVMTPVLANQAAVNEVLKSLDTAGLDDFFVQRLPAGKRRVYLGLFNHSQAANRRVAELKKAGVKAILRPSKTTGSDFFLVVRGLPGRDNDRLLAALPASPSDATGKLDLCERIASR